jgi:hypothetical protein
MTLIQQLKTKLYEDFRVASPLVRRRLLVDEMAKLEGSSIHCFNCPGTCCTFSANSMQITPLEAFEILFSLELNSVSVPALKKKLEATVKDYRLAHDISTGKKIQVHIRRTYTCPFFSPGPKGCTLGRGHKPYGCLGFNPKVSDDNGSSCHSNLEILEKRETTYLDVEIEANQYLQKKYSLYWEKLDLPRALLEILSLKEFNEAP